MREDEKETGQTAAGLAALADGKRPQASRRGEELGRQRSNVGALGNGREVSIDREYPGVVRLHRDPDPAVLLSESGELSFWRDSGRRGCVVLLYVDRISSHIAP